MIYRYYFKRIIDLIAAGIMMIIFSPVFVLITICLFFANRRKPFFIQKRPGRDEKIFSILKFKTMNDKRDVHGKLLPDEKRITAIGRFIRKTSLDEIPQLINVIKGEMSLIGPRPLLIEYLPLYNERQDVYKRQALKLYFFIFNCSAYNLTELEQTKLKKIIQ